MPTLKFSALLILSKVLSKSAKICRKVDFSPVSWQKRALLQVKVTARVSWFANVLFCESLIHFFTHFKITSDFFYKG